MTYFYKIVFFLLDFLLLNVSIIFAFYFYDSAFWANEKAGVVYLLIYSNLAWLFLVLVSAPYSVNKTWTVSKIIKNQLAFIFIHLLVVASLIVFLNRSYAILQIIMVYGFFTTLFFVYRIGVYYLKRILSNELNYRNYILIGKNSLAFEIRKFYLLNTDARYKFLGYIDFQSNNFPIEDVQNFCSTHEVHEIFCCAPDVTKEQLRQLVDFGLDSLIKVKLILESDSTPSKVIQLERYDYLPGIDRVTLKLDEPRNQFAKRIFDLFFCAILGTLVLWWLIPLVGLFIIIDSKGPVFFVQYRSGKDNKPFKCLKFRTMHVNKEADSLQATRGDSRITKLGNFLRRTSIDEIPQFINVLFGSMSVVGPRPHMLKHTEEYSKLIEKFMGRQYAKPGITGLAQCMGYRGETQQLVDMENRIRMDRYYIENWSFWLDIKIIFLTVISLLRGSEKAF